MIICRERPADHDQVRALHRAAFAAPGGGEVALLGAPDYNRRFGFRHSTQLGVMPPDPAWSEHFQARRLGGRPVEGTVRYAEPFARV